jgi:hypothetical protein
MRMRPGFVLVACLLLAACGDENVLQRSDSYTGLWKSDGLAGTTLLFELRQDGERLEGNLYAPSPTGERGDPSPLRYGTVSGADLFFSVAFEGGEFAGLPIDTLAFRGKRRTVDVLSMEFYVCAGDTCATYPFLAARQPAGF